jgi:hypothetical protein
MDISIVLASRERVTLLSNLLESVKRTTQQINRVEVLVGIDDDDLATQKAATILTRKYSFVKFFSRPRSGMLNRDYLNWISADHSKGKYFIICNDDTEFKTINWDEIVCRKLEDYLANKPDRIAYGYLSDALLNRHGLGYCCFPLVTREGMNALGFAIPSEFPAWSADVALWHIYNGVNRCCDISEVMIEHISYHSGTRGADHVNKHVENLSATVEVKLPTEDYINKLKCALVRQPMTLFEKVVDSYNSVIKYQQRINYDTNLDTIWSNNMSDIGMIVRRCQTAEQLIDQVDKTFMYSINFPPENACNTGVWSGDNDVPRIRDKQIDWILNKQKDDGLDIFSLPEHIQESKFVHEKNKTIRNGRVLTGNFLRTLWIYHRINRKIGNNFKSILELGGGAGHQARTFTMMLPDCKYTIVDLPETLIFSYAYMSLNYPNKKLLYVTCPEDMSKIDDFDYVFVPAVFSEMLHGKSYDLFINTASMGEMNNSTIHRWMDFIQNKINIGHIYTLNRFLNVIDNSLKFRLNENECSTSYDHKWNIISWELEPLHCRCPYIDTLHSRYVEIIANRNGIENIKEKSDALYQDAIDEDWYRLEGMYGNGIMQYRSNIMVNDMTMTGTLYKLWESIRLDQNVNNVSAIIRYLSKLIVSNAFEEMYYYESLLRRLKS